MDTIQEKAPETAKDQINNYEEYLSAFFPEVAQSARDLAMSPEEMGVKMAEETLNHIRNILAESKNT